jgi:hypothetical protein
LAANEGNARLRQFHIYWFPGYIWGVPSAL